MKRRFFWLCGLLLSFLLMVVFFCIQKYIQGDVLPNQERTVMETYPHQIDSTNTQENKNMSDSTDTSTSSSYTIKLIGRFLGLKEASDRLERKYTYLLLDEGTQIVRVDLRPLIGYSDIDIINKLGVQRGEEITVAGVMNDSSFTVEYIE